MKEPSLYFLNMLVQVRTLRSQLNVSDEPSLQWEALTRKFIELDDIVDRCAAAESLLPADMQGRLIRLYQTYVSQWDAVESHISDRLLNKRSDQQTSDRCWVAAQQG